MKILRLGNSEDVSPGIADSERAWYLSARLIEDAIGEPVETVVRPIWPGHELPGIVDGWINEHQPDMVFMKVTWFWYGYESVPRRIERIFGRPGKPVARAGLKASKNQQLSTNGAFKLSRKLAHRIIGGDTQYHTGQVLEVMEQTIRRVVARENIALLVKGSGTSREKGDGVDGSWAKYSTRREFVEGGVERLCRELHVPYISSPQSPPSVKRELKVGDGIHLGTPGQTRMGASEGAAMLAAWRGFSAGDRRA